MNYNESKKFTFRRPINQGGSVKQKFQSSFTTGPTNAHIPSTTQHGSSRPNPYINQGKFESPSKKLKFSKNSELTRQIENFDDGIEGWDLDDDDFAKDLTVDELNMLEVEASQRTENKMVNWDELNTNTRNNPFKSPYVVPTLATKSPFAAASLPEKTLDLFSNWKTMDTTTSNEDRKTDIFSDSKVKVLEQELKEYVDKVKIMEEAALARDGEIKILRHGLNKTHDEKNKLMVKLQQIEGGLSQKQNENEKILQREVERLQTQLQFKDKEIMETKEWKLKQESSKTCLHSPKSLVSSNKKSKDSPSFSASKSSQASQNGIFQQNSFDSPQRSVNNGKPARDQKPIGHLHVEKETQTKQRSPSKPRKHFCSEIEFFERELIELSSTQEFNISCQLILQCICKLKGRKRQSIVSILEFIELCMDKVTLQQAQQHQELDLLCQETLPFQEKNRDENTDCGSIEDNVPEIIAALTVLNRTLKHFSYIQDIFLTTMNKSYSSIQKANNLQNTVKRFTKNEYVAAEQEIKHILILKDDDLKRNKGTESVPGDTIESVDGKIDNEAEYQPNNIISKLFQILTSDKCTQSMKDSVYEILVCLSCCCSSVSKTGLVKRLAEYKTLCLLAKNFKFESIISLLLVMKSLASENGFEDLICCCPDNCPLRALYTCLIKRFDGWQVSEWEQIKVETIQSLLTIISSCPKAMKVLVTSECSNELIKSLVIMLFEEYKDIREDYESQIDNQKLLVRKKFLLLRQGMSLLAQISWNDKLFMDHRVEVEWQYLDLVYGTIRLFRRIPFINESEVIAVQDLRDIDQYEEVEDSEEAPNEVPMDQD